MGLVGSTFPISAITGIFGEVLLYSVFTSIRSDDSGGAPNKADALAQPLELDSCYPTSSGLNGYRVFHVVAGSTVMSGAGILAALLAIGSGGSEGDCS